ncbi:MAG TPA: hypothetical protein PKX21_01900, partial [Candidatus Pacearchaeota archaeon]|nr:hypothetical protein [Candidatus Pacearchaeota archaeon]
MTKINKSKMIKRCFQILFIGLLILQPFFALNAAIIIIPEDDYCTNECSPEGKVEQSGNYERIC